MKDTSQKVIAGLICLNLILIFLVLCCAAYKSENRSRNEDEKTHLEVEKLRYELKIYKENEESLK